MKIGLVAAAGAAVLIVVGAAGYLVGESSAPSPSEAQHAERVAYSEAFEASEKQAATDAKQIALVSGRKNGRRAGSDDGEIDADAEIAASQPEPASSTAPGTLDQFGIARPAPGVSPEYDYCIAQGGTPSPDGCLP
jgi:hypothetical protein